MSARAPNPQNFCEATHTIFFLLDTFAHPPTRCSLPPFESTRPCSTVLSMLTSARQAHAYTHTLSCASHPTLFFIVPSLSSSPSRLLSPPLSFLHPPRSVSTSKTSSTHSSNSPTLSLPPHRRSWPTMARQRPPRRSPAAAVVAVPRVASACRRRRRTSSCCRIPQVSQHRRGQSNSPLAN
jgi:hypothetical protein